MRVEENESVDQEDVEKMSVVIGDLIFNLLTFLAKNSTALDYFSMDDEVSN